MAVKQNAIDFSHVYPLAAEAVEKSFYADDGLIGADDTKTATTLRGQLCDLFSHGGFVLRKWNSSDPTVLQTIPPDFRDSKEVLPISDSPRLWVWNGTPQQIRSTSQSPSSHSQKGSQKGFSPLMLRKSTTL